MVIFITQLQLLPLTQSVTLLEKFYGFLWKEKKIPECKELADSTYNTVHEIKRSQNS